MSLPANYPVSLDALANPTATTNRDAVGFELDLVVSRIHDILEALEAKLGVGASLPNTADQVLTSSGTATAWAKLTAAMVSSGSMPVMLGTSGHVVSNTAAYHLNPIPTGFKHLTVLVWARSTLAATSDGVFVRLNVDTGNNYYGELINAAGAGVTAQEPANGASFVPLGLVPAASAAAGLFGGVRVDIPGHTSASGGHAMLGQAGYSTQLATSNHGLRLHYGYHSTNAAVTAVWVAPVSGQFAPGSIVTVLGWPG